MVAIKPLPANAAVDAPQSNAQVADPKTLDGLVDTARPSDVATFQTTLKGSLAQSVAMSGHIDIDKSILAQVVGDKIELIQYARKKIDGYSAKIDRLNARQIVDLQVAMEKFSINSNLLSKAVGTMNKSIDALVRIQ